VRQLTEAGCTKVFREVASGALGDRTQLRRRLTQLKAGNMVLVTRLDRLARSTHDLLNTPATITDRGAGFRSLGDNPASEICRTLSAEIFQPNVFATWPSLAMQAQRRFTFALGLMLVSQAPLQRRAICLAKPVC